MASTLWATFALPPSFGRGNRARAAIHATPSLSQVPVHQVTVHDRQRGIVHRFWVPQDQYILHTAEDQNITLPFACRHGCCTTCAVRVKSGELRQPEALGISAELKSKGYALLCVGFPMSDLEVETQDEDEVYWLQFGRYFARGPVEGLDFQETLAEYSREMRLILFTLPKLKHTEHALRALIGP